MSFSELYLRLFGNGIVGGERRVISKRKLTQYVIIVILVWFIVGDNLKDMFNMVGRPNSDIHKKNATSIVETNVTANDTKKDSLTFLNRSLEYSFEIDNKSTNISNEDNYEIVSIIIIYLYIQKQHNDTLSSLNESLAYSPEENDNGKCENYKLSGYSHYKVGNYEEAIKSFNESLKYELEESERCEINRYMGDSYYQLGKYEEALKSLEEAKKYLSEEEEDKIKYEVYRSLGKSYYQADKFDKAIKSFTKAKNYLSEEEEDNIKYDIYGLMGYSYYQLGKYEEAIKPLEEAEKYSLEDIKKCHIYRYLGKSNYRLV